MGSYAKLKINNYEFLSMKSYVDSVVTSIFSEKDRIIKIEDKGTDDEREGIYYVTKARIAKKRLDIMGFNLKSLEKDFINTKRQKINDFSGTRKEKKEFKFFLNSFSFERYLVTLKEIYRKKIDFFHYSFYETTRQREVIKGNSYIKFVLDSMDEDIVSDPRLYLRGFLEKIDNNVKIVLDVTDVIFAGYYSVSDKIIERYFTDEDKTIIFTEGKYDTRVIKESMSLLFPEYYNYFSFLDVESSGLELNASRISSYLKSFISAGIINKMIFLFDNDAEGLYAVNELKKIKNLPNNFCIKTCPNIGNAKKYPVLCPTGIEKININNSGCSIELYLCDEVLKKDGKYILAQLKGYNERVNRYQIGFSENDKVSIQKNYDDILKKCVRNKNEIEKYNFNNMKLLLKEIINAFTDALF